jgi:hypothetical protein
VFSKSGLDLYDIYKRQQRALHESDEDDRKHGDVHHDDDAMRAFRKKHAEAIKDAATKSKWLRHAQQDHADHEAEVDRHDKWDYDNYDWTDANEHFLQEKGARERDLDHAHNKLRELHKKSGSKAPFHRAFHYNDRHHAWPDEHVHHLAALHNGEVEHHDESSDTGRVSFNSHEDARAFHDAVKSHHHSVSGDASRHRVTTKAHKDEPRWVDYEVHHDE